MGNCGCDRSESRLAFDIAEVLPSTSLESQKQFSSFKERILPYRWLRKRSTAVTAFNVIRCREDWKNLLVKSSSAARQHLANLTHPKVTCFLSIFSLHVYLQKRVARVPRSLQERSTLVWDSEQSLAGALTKVRERVPKPLCVCVGILQGSWNLRS